MVDVESENEARFVRMCHRSLSVRAICSQPIAIPYLLGDRRRNYIHDFALQLEDGTVLLVEVKPCPQWADLALTSKLNAAKVYCASHRWGLLLTDVVSTPRSLLEQEQPVPEQIRRLFSSRDVIDSSMVAEALSRADTGWMDLVVGALRFGYEVTRDPICFTPLEPARSRLWLGIPEQLALPNLEDP